MRITEHPIVKFDRGRKITIFYNDVPIEGYENETIATALYASGIYNIRESLKLHRPRGLFCAIGKCSSCFMEVDGLSNIRTCITPVMEGMKVKTQKSLPKISHTFVPTESPDELKTEIVVVGGGPAGLEAALSAANLGAKVVLIDENYMLGGQLVKQTHKFFGSKDYYACTRGIDIGKKLIEQINSNNNITVILNSSAVGFYEDDSLGVSHILGKKWTNIKTKRLIVATGASEKMISVENNDLPGVYGAGALQTLLNVYGIKVGKKVLIVGAGNVGLIVAYHLLQAGIEVVAVLEALPEISGYFVHAAKIRRHGVQILTSHSITRILGDQRAEGATVVELDKKGKVIAGTEKNIEADIIALAVGLQPNYRLCHQAGCKFNYSRKLGGNVPVRNKNMQTSINKIYIAGDCGGIEEASTAMMEGKISGLNAAVSLGYGDTTTINEKNKIINQLSEFRSGPRGEIINKGLEEVRL